jgi:hypothetical protein
VIQRFTFVKLLDAEAADRAPLAGRLRAALVEAGADATVALPADDSAAKWDLAIVIETATIAAWRTLEASPAFTTLLAELLARAAVIKAWTFDAGD